MPQISAFRGLRYDLGHVGSLSDVVAPPYDVISPESQDELYKKHPANVIRLILNRPEPGDDDNNSRYTRAARFLKEWQREGVLQPEPDPAVYVYHQQFNFGGEQFTRRGFMARVKLEPFGSGTIFPHEETHAAAKADRLRLFRACRANLSQIFGIYPDESNLAQEALEESLVGRTPIEATDHLGVIHRMWPVTDVSTIAEVEGLMSAKPVFIADGHHRYETACNYQKELSEQDELSPTHPANYVLMMCVSMNDPGMIVLPTHRLFRGIQPLDADQLQAKIGKAFTCQTAGEGADLASINWQRLESDNDQTTIALYTAKDQRWTVATLSESGESQLASLSAEHSSDWRGLGVSVLHRLLVEELLGYDSLPKPKYVHQVDEVVEGLTAGDQDGSEFQLAALVMPATLEHIRSISQHGERMPAKSTYFFPKLLSGLVINPLQ